MKKSINTFLLIVILSIYLISCSKPTNQVKDRINYLNAKSVKFLSYELFDTSLSDIYEDYNVFFDFGKENSSNDITVYIFDNRIYNSMNSLVMENVKDLLESDEVNIFIFVNFKNYNFFEGSPFENDKNEYPSNSQFRAYYRNDNIIETHNADYVFDGELNIGSGISLLAYEIIIGIIGKL